MGYRGHTVLNELGGIEVVCANESVSVGSEVRGVGTAERRFEEVGSGKMALTVPSIASTVTSVLLPCT